MPANDITTAKSVVSEFDELATHIREHLAELEDRTRRRTRDLEIVMEVSKQAASLLNLDELLDTVVNLTRERFDLYHAHIYLVDESQHRLALAAGAGDVGRRMLQNQHGIKFDNRFSIVAQTARTGQGTIINDVSAVEGFLPNPMLPATRAEMSVPMSFGSHVLGVLDLQSNLLNRFTEDDLALHTALAAQIAIAVQNARSFAQLAQSNRQVELILNTSGDGLYGLDRSGVVTFVNPAATLMDGYSVSEMLGRHHHSLVHHTHHDGSAHHEEDCPIHRTLVDGQPRHVALDVFWAKDNTPFLVSYNVNPVIEDGEVTGAVISFRDITEQHRNQETVQKRARELEIVARLSADLTTLLDVNELLQSTVDQTRDSFGLYHAHVYLLSPNGEDLVLAAGAGEAGRLMKSRGHTIPLDRAQSLVARAARTRTGVIVNNVMSAPDFLQNPLLPETQSEMAIPMMFRDRIIGVLDVQSDKIDHFSEDDVRIQTILAAQIAVAIQNARYFEERNRLREISIDLLGASNFAGVFTDLNPAWEQVLGWSLDELMSRPYIEFVHPDDVQYTLEEAERQTLAGHKTLSFENRYLCKDGTYRWLAWNATPDQATDQIYFVTRDITERKQQEEALRRSEALYRGIASNFPNGAIVLFDRDFRYLLVDGRGLAEVGLNKAEMENKTIYEIFPPETIPFLEPQYQSALRGEPLIYEVPFADRTYLLHTDPVYAEDGSIPYGLTITQDITSLKQAQHALEKRAAQLATVAEISTEINAAMDLDGMLSNVAEMVKTRFDLYHAHLYLLDEQAGRLRLAAGAGDAGRIMKARGHSIPLHANSLVARAARTGQGVIVNDVTDAPDYLPNPMLADTRAELAVPIIISNRVIGVLDVQSETAGRFSADDINVKTTLAAQIAVAIENARSFAALEQQAERERETAEKLREVDRLKSQFLANMSHELRTPLNSIIGYSEVLLDGVDGDLTPDADEDVRAIHDSGKHLLAIINEILDLAKIEAGQMQLDRKHINLDEFLSEIVRSAHILVKDKPVVVDLKRPDAVLTVHADPVRLRQIMWNLMSNAVKFTEAGSVTVAFERIENNLAHIRVIDTGTGISQENTEIIFQRFSQVDGSSTRRAGGTGLGLTITQQLIQMHGGEIWVDSALGEGSVFSFTLPLVISEAVKHG